MEFRALTPAITRCTVGREILREKSEDVCLTTKRGYSVGEKAERGVAVLLWKKRPGGYNQSVIASLQPLLAFSRKQTLQPEVLDLNALLRNLEQMIGRLIGEDIEPELRLGAELGRVTADPEQIEQVVTNLVVNARDAMPLGGRLTVETAAVELDETYAIGHESLIPGKYALLAVSDTGCGPWRNRATSSRRCGRSRRRWPRDSPDNSGHNLQPAKE